MTPQAEIWVPRTVGKKDLENLLKPIGGRIDMFLESKRIPVRKISLSPMAAFFKEFYPSLKLDPVPTYPEIFSELRDLPPDEQEKLLVDFYSQKVEAFPNGAELGRFLARINNISWFQPKSPPDRKSLKGLCHQTLSRLNHPDLPLIIKENLGAAWDVDLDATRGTIQGVVWNATWDAARGAVSNVARDAAEGAAQCALDATRGKPIQGVVLGTTWRATRSAAQDAADNAVWDATRGAEWIVAKDLMPNRGYNKGNPFEPLVKIYELGCWPIGIVPGQGFVVFVPPIQIQRDNLPAFWYLL